jgi:predicted nucleotidyltransferase
MKIEEILKKYSVFRENMGIAIDKKVCLKFWNIENVKNIRIEKIDNLVLKEKLDMARNSIKYLLVFNWVKFIAVSGSVASGFAKDEDDIDVFIVLKNDRAWIYRAVILFRNIFHRKIRMGNGNVRNKLCVNFIAEERDLLMEEDIFNLNEILSLIPVYNDEYFVNVLRNNEWLFDKYLLSGKLLDAEYEKNSIKRYPVFYMLNIVCLIPQLVFMLIFNHKPDIARIKKNFKRGRIEFFPKDFKQEKLSVLESR